MQRSKIDFSDKTLSDSDLISLYGKLLTELKRREIIRTKNIVGELGEGFAIDHYTNMKNLRNLSAALPGTKNIDAEDEQGKRYAIKSTSGKTTGTFHGLLNDKSDEQPEQLFEYLLIVIFSESYEVKFIYELTWEQFLKHKKWHGRMKAWYVPVNNAVKNDARTVYPVG